MKINENITKKNALTAVLLFFMAGCTTSHPRNVYMYIGSYASPENPGLYVYSYDEETLQLDEIQRVSGHANPGFLAIHPSGNFLYAVNETAGYEGKKAGSVSAFSLNRETGKLEYINRQSSRGAHPCHISVLPGGDHVVAANYSGGNIALLPLAADGALGSASSVIQHEGCGPVEGRQAGPHAHSVFPSPEGDYLFAADLGIDKVMIYRIDNENGRLIQNESAPYAEMPPGSGPRHLDFHPGGKWIYVVNELNSTVTRMTFNLNTGEVAVKESVTTLPTGWEDKNSCADIHVHPSGKFLYASNRGHNSIAIFRIEDDGHLIPTGHEPVRGETPRNFCLDPTGERMFVANQRTDNITIFDIDQKSGELTFTGQELKVEQPVCIKFLTD